MMLRQILIDPVQRDFLRIMWKTGANEEAVIYRLKTVTYGTASAPFLAVRTLKQLAMDEASRFPLASKVALQDVYMDDIVSGAQDLDTARQLQFQLQNMLESCGMKLHKWNSNSKELLNSSSDQEHSFSTNAESTMKTLGISWKPTGDYFMFKVSIPSMASYTKRDVLSVIARLYDSLGLIGPVISKAKIFLQKLWLRKLNWEEFLPDAIAPDWLNFESSLKALEELKIDRYTLADSYVKLMLLGYADASESAYGAVVYMHSVIEDGTTRTKLISSKSRVASIKVITIPRLERSACLLLAQLVGKVHLSLQVHLAKVILHTDSNVAIAWINTPAKQLKTFGGNRVSKIQTLTENFEWKHIPSVQNPADIISRGVNPEELSSFTLWWNGSQHLDIPEQFIDPSITSSDELYMSKLKKQSDINLTSILDFNFENDLLNITINL
ncbi:integrase catalytic domain-containing protein [Trichonephila clavipes]|nr:integrase catalytic domain-containing protein [Trichonephila clavipes]